MRKISHILIFITLFCGLNSVAQQAPHYTQYMYNMQVINPAYVGARADLTIGLLGRSQWVGVDGAPKTMTFALNGRAFDGVGIGFSVINDRIGLATSTDVNIDVSYTIVLSQYDRLAFGLKAGMAFYSNNLSEGITPDQEIYTSISGAYPNIGMGAYYYNQRFYAGISIPRLLNTPKFRIDYDDNQVEIADDINYFATAGMLFELTDKVKFKPSTLIKYSPNLPISIDLNTNFLYNEFLELGISYRYNDSMSGMFAIILNKNFRIGYTYDHTLTDLGGKSLSSHEIMLLLDLDFKKKGRWLQHTSCYF